MALKLSPCACETYDALIARIDELEQQLRDEAAMKQTLWAALTPEKRHELNLADQAETEDDEHDSELLWLCHEALDRWHQDQVPSHSWGPLMAEAIKRMEAK